MPIPPTQAPQRSLPGRPRRAPWRAVGGWTSLAAALAILVLAFDSGAVPRNRLFHPEAIYPAALYLDLEGWRTWNTPFAPYFFPDMPLFFACRWLTGDPVTAIYAFAASQFLLLILGLRWLFGAILADDEPIRRLARRLAVLIGAWLALAFAFGFHGGGVLLQLFTAAFHTGSFVVCVYGLATVITLLDLSRRSGAAGRQAALLCVLFFITCAGVLSDQLLLVIFVLPAVVSLPFCARSVAARLRVAGCLSIGGLLGVLAVPWINSAETLQIATYDPIDTAGVLEALRQLPVLEPDLFGFVTDRFFESLGPMYRGFWLLFVLLTAMLALTTRGRPRHGKVFGALNRLSAGSRSQLSFVALFLLASFATTALATCYVTVGRYGLQVGVHGILFVTRYLISLYTFPIVAAALYLAVLLGARRTSRLEIPQLALLALLILVRGAGVGLEAPFSRSWPRDVACLDQLAAEHGWRYGLAFFSDARRVNVFTRRGLHVDQLTWKLEPTTWIGSRRRPGEGAGYDFVLTGRLRSRQGVVAMLGEPARELECPGTRVLVYAPPSSPAATPPASAPSPRATRNTPSHSSSPPTGTRITPSPGSPP